MNGISLPPAGDTASREVTPLQLHPLHRMSQPHRTRACEAECTEPPPAPWLWHCGRTGSLWLTLWGRGCTKVRGLRVCTLNSLLAGERRCVPWHRQQAPVLPELICWTRGSHRRLCERLLKQPDTAGPGWGLRIGMSHKVLGCCCRCRAPMLRMTVSHHEGLCFSLH